MLKKPWHSQSAGDRHKGRGDSGGHFGGGGLGTAPWRIPSGQGRWAHRLILSGVPPWTHNTLMEKLWDRDATRPLKFLLSINERSSWETSPMPTECR